MKIIRTAPDIPELDIYVGNKENHLLRYFEPEPGLYIAESVNVIEAALDEGYKPYSAVCVEGRENAEVLKRLGGINVYSVEEEAAKKHFGYSLPGGVLCAMRRKPHRSPEEVLSGARRIIVLEDVENPTNVGAIFRSAAALGIDAVILSPACADPYYRRAMRVSVGNSLHIPWTFAGRNEADWKENGVAMLKDFGFTTAAMALRKDNVSIDCEELRKSEKLALIMGNEGAGLCDNTIDASEYVVKIPMKEGIDSLNVAVAAGIAMWEIRK